MLDAHTSEGIAHDASDGVHADGFVMRRQLAHEYGSVAGLGSFVSQVGLQGSACDHRQGQQILATRLRALERDGTEAPVDVGQLQPADLDAAQAQIERKADDGITALGRRQRIGERVQQPVDFLGLQASGQRRHAPVRRRRDDGQQRLHCVAAGGAIAQVRTQRGCDRDGVAGGAQRLQLIDDELAYILGQQRTHGDGLPGKLGQQQPLDDTQATAPGSGGQASGAAHVRVVAAQLVSDRARRRRCTGNDAFGSQDLQHRHQRSMQFHRRAQCTTQAVAAR